VRTTRSRVLVFALIAVLVVALDQASKVWALATLVEGERTEVLGDLLGLSLLFNSGAALSFASGTTWVFTLAATAVTIVVIRVSGRLGSRGWTIALGLLLGGAVGNLIDRLIREPGPGRGHVVDFIAYGDLFVGNIADIAIVAAAVLMGLLGLMGIGLDGSRAPADPAADPAGGTDEDTPDEPPTDSAEPHHDPVDDAPAEAADRR
jgi:signal peptidase II